MAGTAAARFSALESQRNEYLVRGRKCSELTIPTLLPPEGSSGSSKFTTPWQSIGARGVNNLASKLLLALLPPSAPFFKMEVDELTAQEMTGQEGAKDEIDTALSSYVRRVMSETERRAIRTDTFEVNKHLLVAGNVLLYVPEEGRARVYRLDKYVVKRDPAGTLLECVIKEQIARSALPEDLANQIPEKAKPKTGPNGLVTQSDDTVLDLYTQIVLVDGQYQVHQEVEGVVVDGSEGAYEPSELPFLALRCIKVDGEHYGRSYVEEYLGDLANLEQLSKAIVEFAAIAARVIPMVNPNGTTSVKDLQEALNGEPVSGNPDDVKFLQIERYNDFRVAKELIDELTQRLAFAFLLNTAIQRPGERVTAEEIRYMAQELDDSLGGFYAVLSQEFQLPLAKIFIAQLERLNQLPELPKGVVEPKIVTGMDALGRGNDLSNLMQFADTAQKVPGLAAAIDWSGFALRLANGLNVETKGLLKSPEQLAQEQQQAQMAEMVARLGPNAVNQLGGIAQKQMETPQA